MVRKRTVALLGLSILALLLVTVDWRASLLIGLVAVAAGIANLRSAE